MSSPYNFGGEPFQGFTEFDESESFDELGEFGESEFGDLETFETDFEFEPEEERGRRIPRVARGGGLARPIRRGIGVRGRRPLGMRPRRPGVRPPRGVRPRRPRPRPRIPPRPRRPPFPVIFPGHPGVVTPEPPGDKTPAQGAAGPTPGGGASTSAPSNGGGACPTVGRFGNWLKIGNQVTVLLDEDETPIEGGVEAGAGGAAGPSGPEAGPEAAPGPAGAAAPAAGPEGSADAGAPPEGGEPGGGEGELPFAYEFGLAGEFDRERGPITWHGPWSRQGRTIVVHLDEPRSSEVELGEVPLAQTGIGAAGQKAAAKAKQYIAAAKKKAGMPPEKVCWIQNVLNITQGESLATDGIYGPKTRAAIIRFQQKGLKVDGIVGPETTTALIQAALNQIAQASLLPVNGIMNAATQQEIIKFQSTNKLKKIDGKVGPETRGAMIWALGGGCTYPKPKPGPKPKPKPGDYYQVPSPCNKTELIRLVNQCVEDSKRCFAAAHKDLAMAAFACRLNPACNAVALAKYYLAMKKCNEALMLCDQNARRAAKCP